MTTAPPSDAADPAATPWTKIAGAAGAISVVQCLVAVLQSPRDIGKYAARIRNAFDFLERVKISKDGEGWGYMEGAQWGITEVNSWITLAYLSSLHPQVVDTIWPNNRPMVISRIERNLAMLSSAQYTNGAWSPTRRKDMQSHIRTYSSVMALWAFIEAKKGDGPSQHASRQI